MFNIFDSNNKPQKDPTEAFSEVKGSIGLRSFLDFALHWRTSPGMTFIKQIWPILIITLLVLILAFLNYKSGTILIGGDNLHPEFNFPLNIHRSLFAVWQEFQGLGVLGGMGHASDLIRQLLLLLLSVVIPLNMLRFIWTMSMLLVGGIGAYGLIDYLLSKKTSKLIPLIGSLFYLFNLATMQAFYIPFESFTAFFGFLPWILLSTITYLGKQNKKNLIFLFFTLLFATPAWYVPTLFVVFLITVGIIAITCIENPIKNYLIKLGKLFSVIFLVNAFWLLPFSYFTLTNSHTVVDAKINQMDTQTVFLQNKEFGNIKDVMLLKGFWFNYVDPNLYKTFTYAFNPWRNHLQNPFIETIGYLLFAIVTFGVIYAVKTKKPLFIAFAGIFLFAISALVIATPPFSWIDNIVLNHIPLFQQAFRFPFTKFSTLASLIYAVFFSLGMYAFICLIKNKVFVYLSFFTSAVFLIIFTLPMYNGHLFYQKEQIILPKEYTEVFNFFKRQDPNTRIANFPAFNFWGWSFYTWGYGGSGFLWYGIEQPILDNNFSMWNSNNENYYWQLAYALNTKNPKLFAEILDKYQITWLLVDKNSYSPNNQVLSASEQLDGILSLIPELHITASFRNIAIYHYSLPQKPKEFVFLAHGLTSINAYAWSEIDTAYYTYHTYMTKAVNSTLYPFRSLFTGKLQKDIEVQMQEKNSEIVFTSSLDQDTSSGKILHIPSYTQNSQVVLASIVSQKNADGLEINLSFHTPHIAINGKRIWGADLKKTIFRLPANTAYPLKLKIDGDNEFIINDTTSILGTASLWINENNVISLVDNNQNSLGQQFIGGTSLRFQEIFPKDTDIRLPFLKKGSIVSVAIPKTTEQFIVNAKDFKKEVKSCDPFRKNKIIAEVTTNNLLQFRSQNADACLSLYAESLSHKNGYILFMQEKNITGRSLHFWVENLNEKNAPLDTYVDTLSQKDIALVIPPLDQFGRGYALHFDNISIGSDQTINELGAIAVYEIPYPFITNITIENSKASLSTSLPTNNISVSHPYPYIYELNINHFELKPTVAFVLSQSFDPGWHMYQVESNNWFTNAFPFAFGKEIKNHILVNNWENGWMIDEKKKNNQFVMIYLPQYLEYIGFIFLVALVVLIVKLLISGRNLK